MKTEASLRFVLNWRANNSLMWVTVPSLNSVRSTRCRRLVSVATGFGSLLVLFFSPIFCLVDILITALSALFTPFAVYRLLNRMALADSMLACRYLVPWFIYSFRQNSSSRPRHAFGFTIGGGLTHQITGRILLYLARCCANLFFRPQKNKDHAVRDLLVGLFAITVISQLMYNHSPPGTRL